MKQIVITAAGCLFFSPALHAQTKLNATPAYDNINYERQAKQQSSPRNVAKFASMQKDDQKPTYSSRLSTNSGAINLNNNAVAKPEYLRLVHPKSINRK